MKLWGSLKKQLHDDIIFPEIIASKKKTTLIKISIPCLQGLKINSLFVSHNIMILLFFHQ